MERKIQKDNPFYNLKYYQNSEELKVKSNKFIYPVQLSFFPEGASNYGLRVKLGYFYEVYLKEFMGGE